MLFALYDFLAYCLYNIGRLHRRKRAVLRRFFPEAGFCYPGETPIRCNDREEKTPCKRHMCWIPTS